MSSTCRSFQAAFTWLREKEQKARCNLVSETFGGERLRSMAALIESCVNGTAVDLSLVDITGDGCCWTSTCMNIYPDALVHVHGIVACPRGSQPALEARDVPVYMTLRGNVPIEMTMCWGPTRSWCDMRVRRGVITLSLVNDEDIRRVALVQAMLSGFCGPSFHDVGRPVEVQFSAGFPSPTCTEAGVRNQVLPLLPLASHFSLIDVDRQRRKKEYVQTRQGVPTASPGITLSVTCSHHGFPLEYLPEHLQHYILESLSEVDLAHVAMTCLDFWYAARGMNKLGHPYWNFA
jgi:hypothetical protein